jgi:hypothetical protein
MGATATTTSSDSYFLLEIDSTAIPKHNASS